MEYTRSLRQFSCLYSILCDVGYGFVKSGIYYTDTHSWYSLLRVFFFFFNRSWMLDFLKCFCCVYWDNCAALSSVLWMSCIMETELYVANHPCIPGISFTWSCVLTFLIGCWIQLWVFMRISAFLFIKDMDLHSSSCALVYFVFRMIWVSDNEFGDIPSPLRS